MVDEGDGFKEVGAKTKAGPPPAAKDDNQKTRATTNRKKAKNNGLSKQRLFQHPIRLLDSQLSVVVYLVRVARRPLLIFRTMPALRSATSLTWYSAAVPRTWAISDGVSL